MSLFQSNLRKQIRNLPKILNLVKKIHYYSELFTSLLNVAAAVLLAHVARALVAVGLVPASLAVHRVLCAVAVPSGPTLARFGAIRRT